MLKAVLLIIILLACTAVGRTMSVQRRRRYGLLGEILAAMRVLRLRMLNSMEPLGILLRRSDSPLFRDLGNSLWEGGGLAECWAQKRRQQAGNTPLHCLTEGDLHILDGFFQNLGKTGREEQNQLFSGVINEMEEQQLRARSRYLDASKLYTALGALIGIGLCVLIV